MDAILQIERDVPATRRVTFARTSRIIAVEPCGDGVLVTIGRPVEYGLTFGAIMVTACADGACGRGVFEHLTPGPADGKADMLLRGSYARSIVVDDWLWSERRP